MKVPSHLASKLLLGRGPSRAIFSSIKSSFFDFRSEFGGGVQKSTPGLGVVQIGDRPDSSLFIAGKLRLCDRLGFRSELRRAPADCSLGWLISRTQVDYFRAEF